MIQTIYQKFLFFLILAAIQSTVSFARADDFTTKDLNEEAILALSWVQNSAEFKALCYQAFNIAKLRWDMDKADDKKCIIVDIDETIIDNSPFNAGLIGKNYGYNKESWTQWCSAESAAAIPGAVWFLNYVVKTGGHVFYITNRKAQPKKNIDLTGVTMNNLKALGFPQIDKTHVMLRTDTSSKTPRRDLITQMGFRIVLLLGDNLADFARTFEGGTLRERETAVDNYKEKFGVSFIVLPNPIYGNWLSALYGSDQWYKKSAKERSTVRINTLKKFNFSD